MCICGSMLPDLFVTQYRGDKNTREERLIESGMKKAVEPRQGKRQLKNFCIVTRTDSSDNNNNNNNTTTTIEEDRILVKLNNLIGILLESVDECDDEDEEDYRLNSNLPLTTTTTNESEESIRRRLELMNGQNKLLRSLQTPKDIQSLIDRKVDDALSKGCIYVNLKAFTIMHNRCLEYEREKAGGKFYENLVNDSKPVRLTKDELFLDTMNYHTGYLDVLHVCNYMDQTKSHLNYIIYKREIEVVDNLPIHQDSSFLDKYLMPKKTGFYYAIIVNFGRSRPHTIYNKTRTLSSSSSSSSSSSM